MLNEESTSGDVATVEVPLGSKDGSHYKKHLFRRKLKKNSKLYKGHPLCQNFIQFESFTSIQQKVEKKIYDYLKKLYPDAVLFYDEKFFKQRPDHEFNDYEIYVGVAPRAAGRDVYKYNFK